MKTPIQLLRAINPFFLTFFTVISIITLFQYGNTFIDFIELKTYDLRLLSRGRVEPSPAVVLAQKKKKSLDT